MFWLALPDPLSTGGTDGFTNPLFQLAARGHLDCMAATAGFWSYLVKQTIYSKRGRNRRKYRSVYGMYWQPTNDSHLGIAFPVWGGSCKLGQTFFAIRLAFPSISDTASSQYHSRTYLRYYIEAAIYICSEPPFSSLQISFYVVLMSVTSGTLDRERSRSSQHVSCWQAVHLAGL